MGNTMFTGLLMASVFLLIFLAGLVSALNGTWSTPAKAVVALLFVAAGAACVGHALRFALHGVLADENGITTLQERWFLWTIFTPWTDIECFSHGEHQDLAAPVRNYSASAVLRNGGTVRLTTITAASSGTGTRRRVDAIVDALNAQLAERREHGGAALTRAIADQPLGA